MSLENDEIILDKLEVPLDAMVAFEASGKRMAAGSPTHLQLFSYPDQRLFSTYKYPEKLQMQESICYITPHHILLGEYSDLYVFDTRRREIDRFVLMPSETAPNRTTPDTNIAEKCDKYLIVTENGWNLPKGQRKHMFYIIDLGDIKYDEDTQLKLKF